MADMNTNVNIVWHGGATGNGMLKAEYLHTKVAIPTSLGGSGHGADPKELLVSSAATCFIATLTYMLESRKLPVVEHTINSEVMISKDGFNIIHYPQIILSADATEAQIQSAQRAIDGADKGCEVGNLLKKAGVTIEVQGKVFLK
ncbi:OsmC family protein [Psychrobacillus sp. FSL K6-2836]|uniref:OsmC family protein n=1 Tax=Psychrobacillus sp. FSL K6-2836 TaxID=2921548 RepID=UPI0030F8D4C4